MGSHSYQVPCGPSLDDGQTKMLYICDVGGLKAYDVTSCMLLKYSCNVIRGHPYMTSAKFWDFLTPSPPLSAFGTDLQY